MAQGRIKFGVDFDVNASSLQTLQSELRKISNLTEAELKLKGIDIATNDLIKLQTEATELSNIFTKSYNFKLNTVDFDKLRKNLNESNLSLASFTSKVRSMGSDSALAVEKLNAALYKTQTQLKESVSWTKRIGDTFANTVRWTAASTALNATTGSIQKAWGFAKSLDSALNDIRIVTGKSADEMERFAKQANKAAQSLGASTRDYAEASLIYYQQGLSDRETEARTNTTIKAANVTGQSAQAVSEQLTAVWNGYKVSAQEAELYVDKLSAVAATTAADLEELSTGMSRVASAANIMGVDVDQLNAQLATIVSVTREAPESIGTALKTVYARMSDIQAGLDTETTLGEYTQQMAEMGINALDAQGHLRDMGDVVEEIGNKWSTLNREQQTSLAQTIAGTRQYSRMMALFDNWNMYQSSKAISMGSQGSLQKQQEIYLDSLEAKLEKLSTSSEKMYMALVDNEGMGDLIEGLTLAVDKMGEFVALLGGGKTLLGSLGGLALSTFAKGPLGEFISSGLANRVNKAENKKQIRQMKEQAREEEEDFNNPSAAIAKYQARADKAQTDFDAAEAKFKIASENLVAEQNALNNTSRQLEDARANGVNEETARLEIEYERQKQLVAKLQNEADDYNQQRQEAETRRRNAISSQAYYEDIRDTGGSAADREALEKRQKELQIRALLSPEEAKARDERHAENIAALEEMKRIGLEKEKILQKEIDARKKYNEDLQASLEKSAAIEAEAAAKAKKEKADTSAEKAGDKQQKALEILKRQGRKLDGDVFSDNVKISYAEGAGSGHGTLSPEHAQQALARAQAEFIIHDKTFKQLSASLTNKKSNVLSEEFSDKMREEFDWISEHREELDLTEQEWKQVENAYKRYEKSIAKARRNPNKPEFEEDARIAGMEFTGTTSGKSAGATSIIGRNIKQNETAQAALNQESVEEYRKILAERQAADEDYTKAHNQAEEERENVTKNTLDESRQAVEADIQEGNALRVEQTRQRLAELENEEAQKKNILEENEKEDVTQLQRAAFQKFGESIAQTTGGIIQLAGAVSAFQQLPSIWDNQDLSSGEKVLQTILVMGPAVMSLSSGFMSVTSGIGSMVKTFPTAIAGLFGVATAETATGTAGHAATTGVKALSTAIKSNPYLLLIGAIIMAIAVSIVATVAAIKKLDAVYHQDVNAAKKATEQAQALADAYKDIKTEYDALKESISDYREAQSAIEKLTTGTDEWREAIKEANEQVMNLIAQYPELVKYMSSIGGQLTVSDEGLEALDQKEQARVNSAYRAQLQGQISATEASLRAKSTDASQNIEYVDAAKIGNIIGGSLVTGSSPIGGTIEVAKYIIDGITTGNWYDGLIEAFGPIGYLIDSISTGDWNHAFETEMDSNAMEELVKFAAKEGNEDILSSTAALKSALEASENETLMRLASDSRMLDAIVKNADSVEALTTELQKNNEINDALRKEIARSELSNNQIYNNLMNELGQLELPKREDYATIEQYAAAFAEYTKQKTEYETQMDNMVSYFAGEGVRDAKRNDIRNDILTGSNNVRVTQLRDLSATDKKALVQEYYAAKFGIEESDIRVFTNEAAGFGDFDVEYAVGGYVSRLDNITFADLEEWLLEQRVSQQEWSNEDVKAFQEKFNRDFNELEQKAFQSFIGDGTGDFSALTQADVDILAQSFGNLDWQSIKTNPTQLAELKEHARALGLATTDEALKNLVDGINAGFRNYKIEEQELKNNFLDNDFASVFTTAAARAVYEGSTQQVKGQLSLLFKDLALNNAGGANAASTILSSLTANNANLITNLISTTDWSNLNSIGVFTELFNEVSANADPQAVEEFVYQMRYLKGAFDDFNINQASEEFINLQKVLEATADRQGISTDEYDALSKEMQNYFIRMADGTYELTIAAEEFAKKAKEARSAELERQALDQLRALFDDFTFATTMSENEISNIRIQQREEAEKLRNTVDKTLGLSASDLDNVSDSKEYSNISEALSLIRKADLALYNDAWIDAQNEALNQGSVNSGAISTALAAAQQKILQDAAAMESETKVQELVQKRLEEKMYEAGIDADDTGPVLTDAFTKVVTQWFAESSNAGMLNVNWKALTDSEYYQKLNAEEQDKLVAIYDGYLNHIQAAIEDFSIDIDPFEELNKELDKAAQKLDRLGQLANMLTGEEYLENLREQNKVLGERINLSRKALNSDKFEQETAKRLDDLKQLFTKSDVADDANNIAAIFDQFIYDENGYITNYRDVVTQAQEAIRAQGDIGVMETFAEELEAGVNAYYESLGKRADVEAQLLTDQLQAMQNNLSAIEFELELSVDKEQARREFNEVYKWLDSNSGVSIETDNFKSYVAESAATIEALRQLESKTVVQTEEELLQISADQIDNYITVKALEEERAKLHSDLLETINAEYEAQANALEELNGLYEKQIGYLEKAADLIDHQTEAEELLTGRVSNRAGALQAQANIQAQIFKSTLANFQSIAEQYNEDASDAVKAQYFELADAVGNSYITTIEAIQKAYKAGLKQTIEETLGVTQDALNGYLAEQEWWNKGAKYLDTIDRTYQENRLARSFRTAAGEVSDVRAQQRLNDIYKQQLEILRKKDDLTQADFERAEKTLELEKARLALEQARESKTQMRLMRNKDGSYSYQYVANQSKIEEARQQVEDLENELVNIDEAAVKASLNSVAELYSTFIETVSEMMVNGFTIEEEAQLTAMIDFLKKELGEGDDLLRNWASSLGISFEDLIQWNSEDFAAHGLSEGLFKLWQSLSSGDWAKVFEVISASGEDALQTIANALGRSPEEISELLAAAGNNAVDEATSMETAIMRESAAWKELGEIIGRDTSAFNALTKSIMQTIAAASGASILLSGGALTAEQLFGSVGELVNVVNTVPSQVATAKTGGYTGAWGAEGRFILAHEKELILNQADTRNILAAVDIVRSLSNSMLQTVAGMGSGYDLPLAAWELMKDFAIEQNIQIHAEFPDATDSSEIKAAFDELILLATQHAFENK